MAAWLREARLEMGSNAWAGVEDFNWLKKVIVMDSVVLVTVVITRDINGDAFTITADALCRSEAQIGQFYPRGSGASST